MILNNKEDFMEGNEMNLQERLENTDFEAFLELFMINNNPTY